MPHSAQSQYQTALDAGQFLLQRCNACRQHIFYPRELCPHCGASDLAWEIASGGGTVYSTSTIARRAENGGAYNVALIDLDEGVRMMSTVEGMAAEQVRIGLRVQASVQHRQGHGLVVFHPADSGAQA